MSLQVAFFIEGFAAARDCAEICLLPRLRLVSKSGSYVRAQVHFEAALPSVGGSTAFVRTLVLLCFLMCFYVIIEVSFSHEALLTTLLGALKRAVVGLIYALG